METPKVDILVATYNGSKYIVELLQSLSCQTYQNISILVSDDGSSDNTLDLIRKHSLEDPRVVICDEVKKGGVVNNFNAALKHSKSNFIMFCDQDDFWHDNKVEIMLRNIIENERDINGVKLPCLGFSDLKLVNENRNIIYPSFYQFNNLNPLNNKEIPYLLWKSSVYGCTIIMNRQLYLLSPMIPLQASMHDHWYAFLACIFGKIFYVDTALIEYRQHALNVVGSHSRSFASRIKRFSKTMSGIRASVSAARFYYLVYKYKTLYPADNNVLTFSEKFNFLRTSVLPYFSERVVYSLFFSVIWIAYNE